MLWIELCCILRNKTALGNGEFQAISPIWKLTRAAGNKRRRNGDDGVMQARYKTVLCNFNCSAPTFIALNYNNNNNNSTEVKTLRFKLNITRNKLVEVKINRSFFLFFHLTMEHFCGKFEKLRENCSANMRKVHRNMAQIWNSQR